MISALALESAMDFCFLEPKKMAALCQRMTQPEVE